MDLGLALLLYIVVFVLAFFIARYLKITVWSSFIFAVVISSLILPLLFPVNGLTGANSYLAGVYLVVGIATLFLMYWYIFERIFNDRECVVKVDECKGQGPDVANWLYG